MDRKFSSAGQAWSLVRTSELSESPSSDLKNRGDPAHKPLRVQRKPPSESESIQKTASVRAGSWRFALLLSCWFLLVLFFFVFEQSCADCPKTHHVGQAGLRLSVQLKLTLNS